MVEVRSIKELKGLFTFSKILVEDKKKREVHEYLYLYTERGEKYYPGDHFYVTDKDLCAPIELGVNEFDKKFYIHYTEAEKIGIEAKVAAEHSLLIKLNLYKDYHFGYIENKVVFFDITPSLLLIKGHDNKDVEFSIDDLSTVFVRKPKFEEVKDALPRLLEERSKYDSNLVEGRTTYYKKIVDGKELTWMQNNRDYRERMGCFEHVGFDESTKYTLYCTMYEGRDEDTHHINYIEEE